MKFNIRQSLGDMLYVWWLEFKLSFRDQGMLIFFYCLPLAYPLLYAFIYNEETVHEVPAVALDESHSALGREFLRKVDATAEVHFVAHAANMEEARRILRERGAYGIVRVPSSFSADIQRGRQTAVALYCDMSGLLYYKALLMSATDVSLDMNAAIRVAHIGGGSVEQNRTVVHPIDYRDVALFNPTTGFAAFLIPAVLILLLQQVLLLGVGLSAGTARESNRFRDLIPIGAHYHSVLPTVLGKALCYFLIMVTVSGYVLCAVPLFFKLNRLADPSVLFAFTLPYLLACIFFAMTCSVFIKRRENCMPIFVFTSLPLLFISGISWPGAAIPEGWRWLSYVFPSTLGINGYVRINNMGADLSDVLFEYRMLWFQTAFYFFTACLVYRYQFHLARRRIRAYYMELKRKQRLRRKPL